MEAIKVAEFTMSVFSEWHQRMLKVQEGRTEMGKSKVEKRFEGIHSNGIFIKHFLNIIEMSKVNGKDILYAMQCLAWDESEVEKATKICCEYLTEIGCSITYKEVTDNSKNGYYKKLNERFDKRVELLLSLGYNYYKEFVLFAKSEMSARNHNGIPNGVIMHCEDYHFNNLIGE